MERGAQAGSASPRAGPSDGARAVEPSFSGRLGRRRPGVPTELAAGTSSVSIKHRETRRLLDPLRLGGDHRAPGRPVSEAPFPSGPSGNRPRCTSHYLLTSERVAEVCRTSNARRGPAQGVDARLAAARTGGAVSACATSIVVDELDRDAEVGITGFIRRHPPLGAPGRDQCPRGQVLRAGNWCRAWTYGISWIRRGGNGASGGDDARPS